MEDIIRKNPKQILKLHFYSQSKDLWKIAVHEDPFLIMKVPKEFNDVELWKIAIAAYPTIITVLTDDDRNLTPWNRFFNAQPQDVKSHIHDLCKLAIKQSSEIFCWLPSHILTRDLCIAALTSGHQVFSDDLIIIKKYCDVILYGKLIFDFNTLEILYDPNFE